MIKAKEKLKKKFNILCSNEELKINHSYKKHRLPIKHLFRKKFSFPLFSGLDFNKYKNDLFIIHSVFTLQNYILSKYLKLNNIKYVLIPHGGYINRNLRKNFFTFILKKIWIFFFENEILKNSKHVIALTSHEKKDILKNFSISKNQIKIIEYPILYNNYQKIKNKKNIITSLCRADIFHKGLDISLNAFNLSNLKNFKFRLHLTQYSKSKNKIEKIISTLKNKKKIKVLKPVYKNKKIELLKNSKIGLFTSRYEAFSSSVWESLWYGQECVVSNDMNNASLLKKFNIAHVCKNKPEILAKNLIIASKKIKNTSSKRKKLFRFLSQEQYVKKLFRLINEDVK
ncbi:MAG: glycosyltransferase [Candidatus Pelagibacter sp.]